MAKKQITVTWDDEAQGVDIKFESADFRQWSFVAKVLGMAVDHCDWIHKSMLANAQAQQAMQQMAQDEKVRRALAKGGPVNGIQVVGN